jgi:hypothetical protein
LQTHINKKLNFIKSQKETQGSLQINMNKHLITLRCIKPPFEEYWSIQHIQSVFTYIKDVNI